MKEYLPLILIFFLIIYFIFRYDNFFKLKEYFDLTDYKKFDINKIDINNFNFTNNNIPIKDYKQIVYTIILYKTKKALDRLNIPFFLSSGTCLGYYRENKFIDHDYDIDIGIFAEDYVDRIINEMKNEGLIIYRILGSVKGGLELSFKLNGTRLGNFAKIDIFLHYYETDEDNNKKIYWITYSPAHTGRKKIKYRVSAFDIKNVKFMGLNVNVPYPTKKYLEDHYGKDWNVVKKWKDYKYYKSPVSIVKN